MKPTKTSPIQFPFTKEKEKDLLDLPEAHLSRLKAIHWNLSVARLYEEAIRRYEVALSTDGALLAITSPHTGRSPRDKYVVEEEKAAEGIWWGKVNRPLPEQDFINLQRRVTSYLQGREIFVQDCFAGADPQYRIPVRIITQHAWHSLFARNMFIEQEGHEPNPQHNPRFTVIHVPDLHGSPEIDGLESPTFIAVHISQGLVLIGGTRYAGEIKKSIFSLLNYEYPKKGVFPMHASANIGPNGNTAIFFGLSGTGKTTLSADPQRRLIGDDEHGWSDDGVFNFEGGCYAKVIRLSPEGEPEIYATTQRFGTILENVIYEEDSRALDLDSDALTENTRASYPIEFIPNCASETRGPQPRNVVLLTCDAFGVLPPIARLTPEQAMYHFLSGYTAKVAGTERGVTEPRATFSACFGEPFLMRHPGVYAKMLGEKLEKYKTRVWLLNTGWTGGPYGTGHRIALKHTRAMLRAALAGALDDAESKSHPQFGVSVPGSCPDVPSDLLDPRTTWEDPAAYDAKAKELASLFVENFRNMEKDIDPSILETLRSAGPTVA